MPIYAANCTRFLTLSAGCAAIIGSVCERGIADERRSSAGKLFAVIRQRRAARPKRSLADWIALTIAHGLSIMVVSGLVYVTYFVQMTSYDDFRKCDKNSTISRFEWVLGIRPAEVCGR